MSDTALRQRLLYRSLYRGCKETDILIGRYAREALPRMTALELELFAQFLEENDQDIYRWVTLGADIPDIYAAQLIPAIQQFHGLAT